MPVKLEEASVKLAGSDMFSWEVTPTSCISKAHAEPCGVTPVWTSVHVWDLNANRSQCWLCGEEDQGETQLLQWCINVWFHRPALPSWWITEVWGRPWLELLPCVGVRTQNRPTLLSHTSAVRTIGEWLYSCSLFQAPATSRCFIHLSVETTYFLNLCVQSIFSCDLCWRLCWPQEGAGFTLLGPPSGGNH